MKKRVLLLLLAFALILGLTACADNKEKDIEKEKPLIKYAVMTGPTGVGSVNLIENSHKGKSAFNIEESIAGSPDEIISALVSGNLDMAVVPANLASVLYNKTKGKIQALATNNLGVLYVVEIGKEINSLEDLTGKTILSAGKGATPETVFKYIMAENDLLEGSDWNFEFKSEATEVAQHLLAGIGKVALLPEPMVTTVLAQNPEARVVIDLEAEWSKLSATPQITGVLVGRKEFIESIDADRFLEEYKASIEEALTDTEKTAELLGKYSIVKSELAIKSIDNMNLYYMDKEDLQNSLTEYLNVLAKANPQSVGGSVPGEDFFYLGK